MCLLGWRPAHPAAASRGELHSPEHTCDNLLSLPHNALTWCSVVHRCGEEILRRELPAKREAVLKLALTPTQHRVYERYVKVGGGWVGGAQLGCGRATDVRLMMRLLLPAGDALAAPASGAPAHLPRSPGTRPTALHPSAAICTPTQMPAAFLVQGTAELGCRTLLRDTYSLRMVGWGRPCCCRSCVCQRRWDCFQCSHRRCLLQARIRQFPTMPNPATHASTLIRTLGRRLPLTHAQICDRPSEFHAHLEGMVSDGRAQAAAAVAAAQGVGASAAAAAAAALGADVAAAAAAAAAGRGADEAMPDAGFEVMLEDDASPASSSRALSDAVAGTSGSVGLVIPSDSSDIGEVVQPVAAAPVPATVPALGAAVVAAEASMAAAAATAAAATAATAAAAAAGRNVKKDKRLKPLPLRLAEELLAIIQVGRLAVQGLGLVMQGLGQPD